MKYHSNRLLRLSTLFVTLLLPALYALAEEKASITFKDLKAAYRLGETIPLKLETRLPQPTPAEQADLWVAIRLPTEPQLLFITDNPNNRLSFTHQHPYKRNLTMAETTESVLEVSATEALAGNYVLYALFSKVGTTFEQLLENLDAHSRSHLATTSTTLAAATGLDSRPPNTTCIAPPRPSDDTPLPQKLSETGCVEPDNPRQAASGLIPYTVNVPLWTDGATKDRWMAIPDNTGITLNEEGDWIFPVGSVFLKHFYLEGQPIETRLFVRHDDGEWAGYSYEWDDNGTDATLLERGKRQKIGEQTWIYPHRSQCLKCHTKAVGGIINVETAQMNRLHTYRPTGRTALQIDTLAHIGLLEKNTLTEEKQAFPELTDKTAPIGQRARAFLHANCSYCHRPRSTGPHDYRITAPLSALCDGYLLTPGEPENSRISQRLHCGEMPPIGTTVINQEGIAIIDEWINSLESCSE